MTVFSSHSALHQNNIDEFEPRDFPQNSKDREIYLDKVTNEIDSILGVQQTNNLQSDNNLMPSYEASQTVRQTGQNKILSLVEREPQSNQNTRRFNLRSLTPIAEWEGYIDQVNGNEFFVKMVNINTNKSVPEDLATFSVSDVSEHDLKLLKKGAYVRFILGRERFPSGEIRNVSQLFFRRLPAHSKKDFDRANRKAKDLLDSINWIDETKTRRD
ncbi:MAG: hypothetical protein OXG92_04975 [Chloroflexi bacterium]|nr:hypothetical protein [Chloroflexota bacterium]MDE2675072.1 hypothetical protein [Paracoccaceae bacterium]